MDAAIVDIAQPTDETWRAAALARDYPSVPFFALTPLRVADGVALARCAELDFADVLAEGMDDGALLLDHQKKINEAKKIFLKIVNEAKHFEYMDYTLFWMAEIETKLGKGEDA